MFRYHFITQWSDYFGRKKEIKELIKLRLHCWLLAVSRNCAFLTQCGSAVVADMALYVVLLIDLGYVRACQHDNGAQSSLAFTHSSTYRTRRYWTSVTRVQQALVATADLLYLVQQIRIERPCSREIHLTVERVWNSNTNEQNARKWKVKTTSCHVTFSAYYSGPVIIFLRANSLYYARKEFVQATICQKTSNAGLTCSGPWSIIYSRWLPAVHAVHRFGNRHAVGNLVDRKYSCRSARGVPPISRQWLHLLVWLIDWMNDWIAFKSHE